MTCKHATKTERPEAGLPEASTSHQLAGGTPASGAENTVMRAVWGTQTDKQERKPLQDDLPAMGKPAGHATLWHTTARTPHTREQTLKVAVPHNQVARMFS
jgi:hypothetical protein